MKKAIIILLLICAAGAQQRREERQEERREQRREERREQRRRQRRKRGPQPTASPLTGILDPSRYIDWTHAGVVGGIPTNRTQCGATITPSGGTDITDANNINTALQNCGANQYVLLGPGTFYIVNGITFGGGSNTSYTKQVNSVTLRGSGPDKTFLKVSTLGAQDCGVQATAICIWGTAVYDTNYYNSYAGGCALTSGYAKGSTQLTVGTCYNSAMPAVGQHIVIDQRTDDIGLVGCTSSGTTATCTVSTAALDPQYIVGACVGLGGVGVAIGTTGNAGNMQQPAPWPISAVWAANTSYSAGTYVVDSHNHVQRVSTAGTSGASAPAWATTVGQTTTDGTVTWTLSVWGPNGYGYNSTMKSPQRNPTTCNAITAVSGNTFSYTLSGGASNLATVGPCTAVQPWPGGAGLTAANTSCGWATVDTGGTYVSGNPCVTLDGNCPGLQGGMDTGRMCPDPQAKNPSCQTGEISWRSQQQMVTVVSIAGSVLTVDEPIFANNWRASQSPGVWWLSPMMHDDGIESMSVDASNDGGTTTNATFMIGNAYNCWIRNIRSIAGSRSHVWLQNGVHHVTIRDSYFFGTKRGASQSYGIEIFKQVSDLLVENNIFIRVVSAIMGSNGAGTVIGYNYMRDDGYNAVDTMMAMLVVNHGIGQYNLHESNDTPKSIIDNIHGTISPQLNFRERTRGQSIPVKLQSLNPYTVSSYNRGAAVIGSIAGTAGTQNTAYQTDMIGSYNCQRAVWCTGSTSQNNNTIPDDPLASQSLFRWGNYDTYTGAVRWCGTGAETGCGGVSEIPAGFTYLPANTVPANHTLPTSLYLSAKPAWYTTQWGTPPWPSIGPDITGGDAPDGTGDSAGGGMAYRIPAQLVQQNMPLDSSFFSTNSVTSAAWSSSVGQGYAGVTLTGTFNMPLWGTFQLTGMTPAGYNGTYQIASANGPTADSSGNMSALSGGTLPVGTYRISTTRVNASGETSKSGTIRQGLGSVGSVQVTSPCVAGGSAPSYSCSQSGVPPGNPQASTGYNVYINEQSDTTGKMCRQNATPISLGTNYVQSTPLCSASNLSACTNTGGACIEPPLQSTASSTQIQFYLATNPGSSGSGGAITEPLIQTFNADTYYGGGGTVTPPPSSTTGTVTGRGTITGQGKIT